MSETLNKIHDAWPELKDNTSETLTALAKRLDTLKDLNSFVDSETGKELMKRFRGFGHDILLSAVGLAENGEYDRAAKKLLELKPMIQFIAIFVSSKRDTDTMEATVDAEVERVLQNPENT